jgi:hypothetical protein
MSKIQVKYAPNTVVIHKDGMAVFNSKGSGCNVYKVGKSLEEVMQTHCTVCREKVQAILN